MKKALDKFEASMAAAAFAEEGDADTARQIMAEAGKDRTADPQSGRTVAAQESKRKPIGTMIVTGLLSVALYATLLLHQDEVNGTFARAGVYAVLPILTAFLFSFVHGTFTGRFWTVLGVEASSRKGGAKHHA
jgi:hypothetical protein